MRQRKMVAIILSKNFAKFRLYLYQPMKNLLLTLAIVSAVNLAQAQKTKYPDAYAYYNMPFSGCDTLVDSYRFDANLAYNPSYYRRYLDAKGYLEKVRWYDMMLNENFEQTISRNSNGLITQLDEVENPGAGSTLNQRFIYQYDNQKRMTQYLLQRPSGDVSRESYFYDAAGNHDSTYFERKNSGNWVSDGAIGYSYNSSGNLIEQRDYFSNLAPINKELYTYNSSNQLVEVYIQSFYNNTWNDWRHNTYTYEPNGSAYEILYNEYGNGSWKHWKTDSFTNAFEYVTWNLTTPPYDSRKIKCYGNIITDVAEFSGEPKNIKLYPNPAGKQITLQISPEQLNSRLEIYDIDGRLMISEKTISVSQQIDISTLHQGIYILKLVTPEGQANYERFVKY